MLFTTGNLITLAIVLVVLIVYRQLDRDNRSLEKVKKFADRQRDELSAYVEKRAEDLQRFGIELDVQQKAAKVALDRIQTVQEGLAQRAEAIGGIEKRLAEYDAALARLKDMTARVDENLVRIREESDFVDSVGRRVEAAQKDLQLVQRELPTLKDSFAKDSAAALDSFKGQLLAEVQGRVAELQTRVDRAKAEAEEAARSAEAGKAAVDRELQKGLERARVDAEKLEDLAFAKLKESSDAKSARLKELIEEKFAQLGTLAKEKALETQNLVKVFKAEWKAEADEAAAGFHKKLEETQILVSASRTEWKAQAENAALDFGKKLEETQVLVNASKSEWQAQAADATLGFGKKLAETEAEVEAFKAEWQASSARIAAELGASIEEAETRVAASAASAAMTEKAVAETAARSQAAGEALVAKIKAEQDALEAKIRSEGAAMQAKAFEEYGRRLAEYGSEIEARYEKLEAQGAELGTLDKALRTSMDQVERKIENDFEAFGHALEDKRKRFEESFVAEAAGLRAGMKAVEDELDALKKRAYDNVSEKLKVFEDEFFVDLKARGESTELRLEAWKADLDRTLADLSAAAAAERAEVEKAQGEEMRERLAENQARVMELLEKARERSQAVQDGVAAQSGMATEALAALKDSVLKDAADARSTAQAYVEGEISRFTLEAGGKLKAAERDLATRLEALGGTVGASEEAVAASRAAVEEAATSLRARFAEAVAETESKARSQLEAFSTATTALLERSRADYESQSSSYMTGAQAERDRLTRELASLADRSAELRTDLSSRVTQALEGFSRSFESLSADFEKKRKEAEAEGDQHLRLYKDAVQDLSLKLETQRAQAYGKIESESARLSQGLAEIDKQLKSYVGQTKLFERTDELRESLTQSIETMKTDLAKLDGRKAEVTEIENQLGRVKRLEDEINQKVTRFLAEKKRIDALEADFTKLAAISDTVDRRLEEVTGQADQLTEAQANVRKILELTKDAESKFDRLEKKQAVMDATVEAVDKNFQSVQAVEKAVATVGAELRKIPERVVELKRSVDELAADKEKVAEAVSRLAELDGIIADAEKRVAEVQKAREWLARAETRLEEIDRKATEQLKLLSDILKDEDGGKKSRGAPPSSAQDTVRKLARQGWNVEEIARAVKISRGEVELILELGAKG